MTTTTITITKQQVASGDDSAVPAVTLKWGESAIYQLDAEASALYHFRVLAPMTLAVDGVNRLAAVSALLHAPNQLTVTMLANTPAWTRGKATFYFGVDAGARVALPPPFDPVIDNGGDPTCC